MAQDKQPPRRALIRPADPASRPPRHPPEAPPEAGQGHELGRRMLELARQQGLDLPQDPALLEDLARLQVSRQVPERVCRLAAHFLVFAQEADRLWGARQDRQGPDENGPQGAPES